MLPGEGTDLRERGPRAFINYTLQSMEAQNSVIYLVSGGVLDRNPGAKVAIFFESGAAALWNPKCARSRRRRHSGASVPGSAFGPLRPGAGWKTPWPPASALGGERLGRVATGRCSAWARARYGAY